MIAAVAAPDAPFSVKQDLCSERLLVPGGSCTITVEFSPPYNYDNFYYGVLNIPLKDSYGSTFAVFLSGNPFITLSSPPNNASFDACSLYSPPTFAWKAARDFTNYQIMISLEQPNRAQSFKVKTSGTTTETVIPSASWKRILSALGERGGRLKWEVFGALPPYHSTGTILIGGAWSSEYRFINLDLSHPLGNPTISSTSKSSLPELSWQNNCNIKFKVWFGSDDNFNNRVTYTFNTKNPVDNEGQFNRTLTASQWKSVKKLVGDENDSTIYWYVESWDGLGSYTKTDVMSFVLAD